MPADAPILPASEPKTHGGILPQAPLKCGVLEQPQLSTLRDLPSKMNPVRQWRQP
jgi:hypothetical protein